MKAIIIGSCGGIGSGIVKLLSQENWIVFATVKNRSKINIFDDFSNISSPNLTVLQCDLSKYSQIEDTINFILSKNPDIDVVINCAGILGELVPIHQANPKRWDEAININLSSVFYTMRLILPYMINCKNGIIINLSSNRAKKYSIDSGMYSVSKFGLEALTNIADMEVKNYGTRCFSINPGRVATKLRRLAAPTEDPKTITQPNDFALFCLKFLLNPSLQSFPCSIDYEGWRDKIL